MKYDRKTYVLIISYFIFIMIDAKTYANILKKIYKNVRKIVGIG
jgi:hypothetical protein